MKNVRSLQFKDDLFYKLLETVRIKKYNKNNILWVVFYGPMWHMMKCGNMTKPMMNLKNVQRNT